METDSNEHESNRYYRDFYKLSQRSGLQGFGNSLIDRRVKEVRSRWQRSQGQWPDSVLELGASSGEHLRYEPIDSYKVWTGVDLRPGLTDHDHLQSARGMGSVNFVAADVEALPFEDDCFDQVVMTCVLHHLSNPERCLREARRILRPGGTFVLAMPTDPGILNRLIKTVVTYRQMKRAGDSHPRLTYAREHRNHIGSLLELLKFNFVGDSYDLQFWPFGFLKSWNLNLIVSFTAQKAEKTESSINLQ